MLEIKIIFFTEQPAIRISLTNVKNIIDETTIKGRFIRVILRETLHDDGMSYIYGWIPTKKPIALVIGSGSDEDKDKPGTPIGHWLIYAMENHMPYPEATIGGSHSEVVFYGSLEPEKDKNQASEPPPKPMGLLAAARNE